MYRNPSCFSSPSVCSLRLPTGRRPAIASSALRRLQQMVALQRRVLRHVVLPHVIGDLVPAARRRPQRLRIQFADTARREDGRLDAMRVEQLDQPPDADAAAELALGKLHRRLVQQASQQHGIEIGGEVDRDPRARRARSGRRCAGGVRRSVCAAAHRSATSCSSWLVIVLRPLCNNSEHTTSVDLRARRAAQSGGRQRFRACNDRRGKLRAIRKLVRADDTMRCRALLSPWRTCRRRRPSVR